MRRNIRHEEASLWNDRRRPGGGYSPSGERCRYAGQSPHFGCIIARLGGPSTGGRLANVVLGLDSLEGYTHVSPHFGAVVGRFANRIAGGSFAIDGTRYRLETNKGPESPHGGWEKQR